MLWIFTTEGFVRHIRDASLAMRVTPYAVPYECRYGGEAHTTLLRGSRNDLFVELQSLFNGGIIGMKGTIRASY